MNVGDIQMSSWGYEQTNVDFYQVVKASKCTVTVKRLLSSVRETGFMCGYAVPVMEFMCPEKEGERHKVCRYQSRFTGKEEEYIKLTSLLSAGLWNGEPHYCSWYA